MATNLFFFFVFQDSAVETDLFKSLLRRPSSSSSTIRPSSGPENKIVSLSNIALHHLVQEFFFLLLKLQPTHWGTNGHSTCPASHLQRVNRSVIFSEPCIHVSIDDGPGSFSRKFRWDATDEWDKVRLIIRPFVCVIIILSRRFPFSACSLLYIGTAAFFGCATSRAKGKKKNSPHYL